MCPVVGKSKSKHAGRGLFVWVVCVGCLCGLFVGCLWVVCVGRLCGLFVWVVCGLVVGCLCGLFVDFCFCLFLYPTLTQSNNEA